MVWGGWDGHQPKQCVDVMAPVLQAEGFEVQISDTLDVYLDKDRLAKASVIVQCWTMGKMTKEQAAGLCDAVKAGTGLAGWHGGLCDSFRDNLYYQWMTGGQFVGHPGGIIPYKVHITKPKDPIMQGLSDFSLESEQYYMLVDPGTEVLANTTFSGKHDNMPWLKGTKMPMIWKRPWGEGKIFFCAPGHVAKDFEVPEVKEIIKRGILWACRS
jgi:type 1 glutamine amidotransferase